MTSKKLGIFGEKLALNYLKKKGYQILDKNYSPKWSVLGEIDIIAKKNNIISFVEVKTLNKSSSFFPEDKVNFLKQRKLIKLSQSWLVQNKIPLNSEWQIDIISIKIDLKNKKATIRHFENAIDTNF